MEVEEGGGWGETFRESCVRLQGRGGKGDGREERGRARMSACEDMGINGCAGAGE
jgi:hypothetical protein